MKFFDQYAVVKDFNVRPRLNEYEKIPGRGWMDFDAILTVYRKMPDDLTRAHLREVPQSVRPTRIISPETAPTYIFQLPRPTPVTAVRLRFEFEKGNGTTQFHFSWLGKAKSPSDDPERSVEWPQITTPGEHTRVVWLDDVIELFRIAPGDGAAGLRLKELVFLEPVSPP
jgi:hypothetical protein